MISSNFFLSIVKAVCIFVLYISICHTLISSGDNCLSACGFLPVMLSCLKPISVWSVRFHDVSEGNEKKNTQNGGEKINLGGVLQPWAHLGPLGSFNMKQPACLGEHVAFEQSHRLAWVSWAASFSLILAIKGRGRLRGRGSAPLIFIFHLKLVRRRRKKEKIKA